MPTSQEPYLAVNNVRVPAGFAFARESSQRTVSDWLAYVENFCSGMRVAHPVALAALHLQDEALRWYIGWQGGRDSYGIPWAEFSSAMLASSLVDRNASQDLLDQKRMFLSFGLHMMKARALLSLLFLLLPSVAAAQSCDPTPSRQLSSFPGVHVLRQMTLVHQPPRPATTAQVPGRIKRSACRELHAVRGGDVRTFCR